MLKLHSAFIREVAMTDTRYCYSCRTFHPADQVVLHETKAGKRWRCQRSIMAAQLPVEIRDSVGRTQSEENRALARRLAQNSMILRHSRSACA